ncbi:undecaprenyl-diphosphate phosphatase [Candidatus Pacearchaeota archaeon]|nr:undecaprenyl-diphosphate phosphatase [Candidatus Pacearchaeota archaeon]
MNEFLSMLILAVVQGIAEWVPISSSGHLVLVSKLIGYELTLPFILALHFGTLMAVFVYFGREITDIIRDLFRLDFKSENGRMGLLLIIATIPAGIAGFLLRGFLEQNVENLGLLNVGLAITGIVLLIGSLDIVKKGRKLTPWGALIIGCVQILSLFRGISRSGTTISNGLLLGLNEKQAVTFSFLLSIPVVFGANVLLLGNKTIPPEFFLASLVSFIIGIATIHIMFKLILSDKKNLRWVALYVLLVALSLGIYLLFR